MSVGRVSFSSWLLMVLTGLAMSPHGKADPWRNEWSFAAAPSLASAWFPESSLAFADDGDFLLLLTSHANTTDQFIRVHADGSVRWAANLAKGPGGYPPSPSALLAAPDGGGYAARGPDNNPGYVARVRGDGTLAWSRDLPALWLARIGPDRLVAADCQHFSVIDADTGTVLWQRVFDVTPIDCERSRALATDDDSNIYFTYRQASASTGTSVHVIKHDPSGQLLWDQTLDSFRGARLVGVGGDLLYVEGADELRALRTSDGSAAWANPIDLGARSLLDGGTGETIVVDSDSVKRLAATDGMPRWTTPVTQAREYASVGDALVVETIAGLSKLDVDNGAIVWTQALPQADADGHVLSYFAFGPSGSNNVLAVARPEAAGHLPPILQRLDFTTGSLQDNPTLSAVEQGIFGASVVETSGDVVGAGLSWANELPELHLRRLDSTDGSVQWQTSVPVAIGALPLPLLWQSLQTQTIPLMHAAGSSTLVAVDLNTVNYVNDVGCSWVAMFDNASGALRWSTLLYTFDQSDTVALAPIADADGNVYFSVASRAGSPTNLFVDYKLYKLAAADGAVLWSTSESAMVPFGYVPPQPFQVIGTDVLQFGYFDPPLEDVAIRRRSGVDGSILWTRTQDPHGIEAVYPTVDGGLIVRGIGWAKLDATTGAAVWSAACGSACYGIDEIALADGNLLSVGQEPVGAQQALPTVSLLRNDGSGTFEHWQLESSASPFQRVNALQLQQDAAGEVWLRMFRFIPDSRAGLGVLAPFDLASGTLGDQQVISIKQTDIGRDTYYTELLGAPDEGSLLLGIRAAHGLSATSSGNLQLDTHITARGDIELALEIDPAPAAPGATRGFVATITYQGDAPVEGARFDLYSPWPAGLVDLDCTVVAASNCVMDARTGNLHASFDLQPGAVVTISGQMIVLADLPWSLRVTAAAFGPVGLAEPDTRNNFAVSVTNDFLFADGFD